MVTPIQSQNVRPTAPGTAPETGPARPPETDTTAAAPASAADVETVLARWLDEARAGSRSSRSVSAVIERLRSMERERAARLARRRVNAMKASAVLQGIVGIAAAALSAVSGGAGIAVGSIAQAGTQTASVLVHNARILQVASDVGSSVLSSAGPHADPFAHRAESLALGRDAADARAGTQESLGRLSAEHTQAVMETVRRAVEILDRCHDAADGASRIALSRPV